MLQTEHLTEDQFIARFRPEENEEGGYYRQRDWCNKEDWALCLAADKERRLWTALDDDNGEWCLCSGYHYVNRFYYVIVEIPYTEGADIVAQDPYEVKAKCAECGEDIPGGDPNDEELICESCKEESDD